MNSTQYTIRSVPPKVDKALRQQARKNGQSLNETIVNALAKAAGVDTNATYNDLDWLIGSHTLDDSFDQAQNWLDSAPKEIS